MKIKEKKKLINMLKNLIHKFKIIKFIGNKSSIVFMKKKCHLISFNLKKIARESSNSLAAHVNKDFLLNI